jgi:hypothetical protein
MKFINQFWIKNHNHILFIFILALGIFARVWGFGRLPPGLNADEASIGIDAFNLLHYGIDRNGISFPVQFISWESGQNALDFIGNKVLVQKTGYFQGYFVGLLAISDKV